MPRDLLAAEPRDLLAKPTLPASSSTGSFARGALDAATFGFSDELAGMASEGDPTTELARGAVDAKTLQDKKALRMLRAFAPMHIPSGEAGSSFEEGVAAARTQARADDEAHGGSRLAGQLVGSVATGFAGGGVKGGKALMGRAAAEGGLYGLGSGEGDLSDRADEAAIGAATGAGGSAVLQSAGRALSPHTDKAVKALLDQDVPLTVGRMLGKTAAKVEDRATSVLGLGDLIAASQEKSLKAFNRTAINRTLAPVGKKLPDRVELGHDAIEFAQQAADDAYADALRGAKLKFDGQFQVDLDAISEPIELLDDAAAKQIKKIGERLIAKNVDPLTGQFKPNMIKKIDSELGRLIRKNNRSQELKATDTAEGLEMLRGAYRDMIARQNPQAAESLARANESYAHLVRIERAARDATDGVFTPKQLRQAIKEGDSSTRKRAVSAGNALMQDLSDDATAVLPSQVPNSGTPERLLQTGIFGGLLRGAYALEPMTLGAAGLAAMGYTEPGRRLAKGLLVDRPQAVRRLGQAVGTLPVGLSSAVLVEP